MMRRVVVVVYLAMLVLLVLVAQAHEEEESSSSTGEAAMASVASLPGDEGKTPPGSDCVETCPTKCWVFQHVPQHYAACLELCKKHCNDGPLTDHAIYTCTFACADSMPIRQLASDHAVGGNVEACFEKCKKHR
ncbi:uncharacterized protein LOC121247720 [Juglans microcarpa x Juglans regia]|uniref:uncharacterized protein LOC121247720 n=1 Tax=Juglans microcarpa x Juglans regia TaxID=2249226 RepID=UPI001B7E8845|nr:uncharacterized protein LOC121247720 [Juglans microcarpa x Juglans regia]